MIGPLIVLGNNTSYARIVELNVNFEDAMGIMAHVFPKLLVVHGTAGLVIGHAVRFSRSSLICSVVEFPTSIFATLVRPRRWWQLHPREEVVQPW